MRVLWDSTDHERAKAQASFLCPVFPSRVLLRQPLQCSETQFPPPENDAYLPHRTTGLQTLVRTVQSTKKQLKITRAFMIVYLVKNLPSPFYFESKTPRFAFCYQEKFSSLRQVSLESWGFVPGSWPRVFCALVSYLPAERPREKTPC